MKVINYVPAEIFRTREKRSDGSYAKGKEACATLIKSGRGNVVVETMKHSRGTCSSFNQGVLAVAKKNGMEKMIKSITRKNGQSVNLYVMFKEDMEQVGVPNQS